MKSNRSANKTTGAGKIRHEQIETNMLALIVNPIFSKKTSLFFFKSE